MSKSKNTNNVTAKMYDTLVRPVITEKSMLSSENGKVTFMVPLWAGKNDVKSAKLILKQLKSDKDYTINASKLKVADFLMN